MRNNLEDVQAFNTFLKSGKFSNSVKVLSGDATITANGSLANFFDANGATRIVSLPPLEKGRFYFIANSGAAGTLDVRTASGAPVTVLPPGESSFLVCSEGSWGAVTSGASGLYVFTDTVDGLVPAPHTGGTGTKFLRDDGVWGPAGTTVTPDGYKFMTDGTNTATGVGADTFRYRSSDSSISLTVTNNQATFNDNVDIRANAANINHNGLQNYVANQHVDHSAVVLTAGTGISGGGDITASRSFDFAPSELTVNAAPASADYVVMDLAAGGPRRSLVSVLNTKLDHNTLLNYVADQHVAHSGVSVVAGPGLNGGGNLTTSRILSLDLSSLAADSITAGDFLAFYDVSAGDTNRATLDTVNRAMDHNVMMNYDPTQHFGDSPSDGKVYGRQSGAWAAVVGEAPNDNTLYARTNLGWTRIPKITVSSTAPSSPGVNDVWIDTT